MDALVGLLGRDRFATEPGLRVTRALDALLSFRALAIGTDAASRRCLQPTAAGHAWLATGELDRLDPFLAPVRSSREVDRIRGMGLCSDMWMLHQSDPVEIWERLLAVYRSLPREGGVPPRGPHRLPRTRGQSPDPGAGSGARLADGCLDPHGPRLLGVAGFHGSACGR
jgi:hypothetical protein